MERTDLQDTTIEAHRIYTRMLREKGPEWRIQRTLEMIQANIDMFPEQTKRTIEKARKSKWPRF